MPLPILHRAQGATVSLRLAERGVRTSTAETADVWALEEWFSSGDVFAREALLDAAALLVFDPDQGHRTPTEEVFAFVAEAVADGRLRVERLRDAWPTFRASERLEKLDPREPEPTTTEKKTFVAVRLVDEDDPSVPVPFKRYRVELPGGSVREGMLDQHGYALIDQIDPGDCAVSFPDFDASAWKKG